MLRFICQTFRCLIRLNSFGICLVKKHTNVDIQISPPQKKSFFFKTDVTLWIEIDEVRSLIYLRLEIESDK